MIKPRTFTNIGSRNKGSMWEYITACAYRDLPVVGSKYRLTKLLAYGEKESNQHCLTIDEIASNTKLMMEELEAGLYTPDFFKNLRDYYRDPLEGFRKYASMKSGQDFSNEELIKAFGLFSIGAAKTYPPMLIGFFAAYLDGYFTEKLKAALSMTDVELINLKTTLLTMPRSSIAEREEEAITALVKKVKEEGLSMSDESVKDGIKSLVEGFGWFHMEYAGDPLKEPHYRKLIEKRLTLPMPKTSIEEAKAEVARQQKEFFKKHGDKKLRDLVFAMQELAFILDDSKAVTVENHYLIYPLLKEMAHRISIPFKGIYFLSGPEIISALRGGSVDTELIKERKKYRAVFLREGKIEVLAGKQAKEAADSYIEVEEIDLNQDVKGIVAYPGIYRGKVSVVLNPDDHGKFKDGDVLVTRDGSAEFTYFLQHSGAIVTDQGGIISHVAIVARECKKPAVLSTRVATKVFKDGDMVEVDAEKGIVRKV